MEQVKNWAKRGQTLRKVERFEAYFSGHGFDPHRHDTYAIGMTLGGVHRFNYRKNLRHNLPGGIIALHPDELHDGSAGTDAGFQYRIAYIEPALLQRILGGQALPFIADGVSRDPRLVRATQVFMRDMDCRIDPLEEDDALYDLAQALAAVGRVTRGRKRLDYAAAERAREYMHGALNRNVTLEALEAACDRDRWSLSRDFRALYGTSPYRYITMRRLDHVRDLLQQGVSPADAAHGAGFHDQSHMTGHFTRTYGLSPGRWLRLIRQPAGR